MSTKRGAVVSHSIWLLRECLFGMLLLNFVWKITVHVFFLLFFLSSFKFCGLNFLSSWKLFDAIVLLNFEHLISHQSLVV